MVLFYRVILIIYIFLFQLPAAYAQKIDFSQKNKKYYDDNRFLYEKWLGQEKISKILKIYAIEINEKEETLDLILESNFSTIDSTVSAWRRLKHDYDFSHPDSLEERLFKKFCIIMDIPFNQGYIEIHHKINKEGEEVSCFVRRIYIVKNSLSTEKMLCKTEIEKVVIENFDLKPDLRHHRIKTNLNEKPNLINIKKTIDSLFIRYYIEKRNGKLDRDRMGKRYKIYNIENEVLKEVKYSVTQRLFKKIGWDVGRLECLFIEIDYDAGIEDIEILLKIDGKYGSKTYPPVEASYLDMEGDFDYELQSYVKFLGRLIRQQLVTTQE